MAVWVILHHLTGARTMLDPAMQTLPAPLQSLVHGGYLAVGTFFVLSGFVLARSYASLQWDTASLFRYCVARYARVYPVYVLSLVVMIPFILADLGRPERTGPSVEGKAAVLASYGFVLQGWVPNLPVHWNTPAWSLSCELFFYLCFPVAGLLLRRSGALRIGLLFLLAVVLPIVLVAAGVPSGWKPLYHLSDFLAGMLAAKAFSHLEDWEGRGYWFYLPAGTLALLLIAFPFRVPFGASLNTLLLPLNAAVLVGLALGGGLPVHALSTRLAAFLGRASYSMYILHVPALWWFKRFFTGVWSAPVSTAIYLAGVIAIAGVVCEKVEEPANRLIRKWANGRALG